jgi:predicted nucleotidyltransferase
MPTRASAVARRWRPGSTSGSNGVNDADDSLPPTGPAMRQAFEALVSTLQQRGIRYAIIGGIAIIQHTRVRSTDDIDVLLTVSQVAMPGLFDALRDSGFAIDVPKNMLEFRDDGLTTLRFGGVLVDLMRPILPAYAHVLDRAIEAQIFGRTVPVSSAEGLIVMKLIAMRPQDESDVRDLLAAYGKRLDLAFIRTELDALCAIDDPRRARFEALVRETIGTP